MSQRLLTKLEDTLNGKDFEQQVLGKYYAELSWSGKNFWKNIFSQIKEKSHNFVICPKYLDGTKLSGNTILIAVTVLRKYTYTFLLMGKDILPRKLNQA